MDRRRPAFFLDFDGTLAPIVSRPELARMPAATGAFVRALTERYLVCILSGRTLQDLRKKIEIPGVYYGADHGRHIIGPPGSEVEYVVGAEAREDLRAAGARLQHGLADTEGVIVEMKDLSLSVHYRLTPAPERDAVAALMGEVATSYPALALGHGKLVHELRPRDGWDKGQALLWLLERLDLTFDRVCPICVGDDLTDEDMFRATGQQGVSILVGSATRDTLAEYSVADPDETVRFLADLTSAVDSDQRGYD